MHRIDTPTAQPDKFGPGKNGFTGGNPQAGQLPTALDQDFFDALQEEIARVVEGAGLELDKQNHGQMLAALGMLFATKDSVDGKQPLADTLTILASLMAGANKLPYFTGNDTASVTDLTATGRNLIGKGSIADVLSYLGLGDAAKRGVGSGVNQIPDMSFFSSGSSGSGSWIKLPSGVIIQFGVISNTITSGGYNVTYPTPFSVTPTYSLSTTSSSPIIATAVNTTSTVLNGVSTWNLQGSRQTNSVNWISIGY